MTRHEYWDEIQSLRESIAEECKGKDRDEVLDYIHETIDGHEYVIYTAQAREVLTHSNNPDALIDDFGAEAFQKDDFASGMAWSRLAYCALERDVMDGLNTINDDVPFPAEEEDSANA